MFARMFTRANKEACLISPGKHSNISTFHNIHCVVILSHSKNGQMASFAQHSVSNKKAFNTPFVLPDLRLCSQVKAKMLSQVSIVHGSIAHLGLAAPYLRAYRSGPFDGRPACQWWHCTFPALACLLRLVSGVPQGQFAAPTATSWPRCTEIDRPLSPTTRTKLRCTSSGMGGRKHQISVFCSHRALCSRREPWQQHKRIELCWTTVRCLWSCCRGTPCTSFTATGSWLSKSSRPSQL